MDDAVGMGNAGKDIYDNIEGYVSSPKEFINGVLSSVKSQSWDALSSYMVGTVGKSCVLQQLSVASGTTDTDAYLESLGVSNLRYDNSSWCREGSSEVKIVVD